jgi:hypothetical protein
MATAEDRQAELEEQRGYGAAEDDVNAKTPEQVQQRHVPGQTDGTTAEGLTEQAEAEESRRGREAS